METAYAKCAGWLDELMAYLEENGNTEKFVRERMPKAKMDHPEGTYIFWIDFRGYGFDSRSSWISLSTRPESRLTMGGTSGPKGRFARINIGTNREMLKEALEKIAKALEAKF